MAAAVELKVLDTGAARTITWERLDDPAFRHARDVAEGYATLMRIAKEREEPLKVYLVDLLADAEEDGTVETVGLQRAIWDMHVLERSVYGV